MNNGQSFAKLYERPLPYSPESEMALLGALIVDPKVMTDVRGIIAGPGDFYNEGNGAIFSALASVYERDPETDLVGIADALRDAGKLEQVGGVDFLEKLAKETPSSAGAMRYARTVADKARLRTVIDAGDRMIYDALNANGEGAGEVIRRARDSLDIKAESDGTFLDVADLCQNHPRLREPVVKGILRVGETANLVGASKSRKSWMMADLLLSVATGSPWLGFETLAGPVLLIDNELHAETIADRMRLVAQARGFSLESLRGRVMIQVLRGGLLDIYQIAPLVERAKSLGVRLVGLDALYRFLPAGENVENSNGAMSRVYNQIDSYAKTLGAAFVMNAHASKGSQSEKAITDMGAGAGAQSRATDTHLVFRPHQEPDAAVFAGEVRSWAPIQPMAMRWTFPLWQPAPDLDPEALQRPKPAERRQRDGGIAWSPTMFASKFVSSKPQARTLVIAEARSQGGLSKAVADEWLDKAINEGAAFERQKGKNSKVRVCLFKEPLEGV